VELPIGEGLALWIGGGQKMGLWGLWTGRGRRMKLVVEQTGDTHFGKLVSQLSGFDKLNVRADFPFFPSAGKQILHRLTLIRSMPHIMLWRRDPCHSLPLLCL